MVNVKGSAAAELNVLAQSFVIIMTTAIMTIIIIHILYFDLFFFTILIDLQCVHTRSKGNGWATYDDDAGRN